MSEIGVSGHPSEALRSRGALVRGASWATILAALGLLLGIGCASSRNLPCRNAGQCEQAGSQARYCLQSRCVECLENAGCGEGNQCVDGACVIRCAKDSACPSGGRCADGTCKR